MPPSIVDCPSDILIKIEGELSTPVLWKEPSAKDTSDNVTLLVKTHRPGQRFGIGSNFVTYIFADPSNNMASCTFTVEVSLGRFT